LLDKQRQRAQFPIAMNACHKNLAISAERRPMNFVGAALAALFLLLVLPAAAADSAYAAWIKPWAERPLTSPALGEAGLKVIVSTITGEAESSAVAQMNPVERLNLAYRIRVAADEVATNGVYRSYFVSNTGSDATGSRPLAEADFQKLTELLGQLPDDHAQLPPAGRRVVVQVAENGQWRVRVYDGNQLPPEVKAVLEQLANPFDKQL
jgi:hypothetical protein